MADQIGPSKELVQRKLGRADKISPVTKAPGAGIFDLDRYMENRVEERGGHKFPLEGLINEAGAGLPAGWESTLANTLRGMPSILGKLGSLFAKKPIPASQTVEGAEAMSRELLGGYDTALKELGTRQIPSGTQLRFPGMLK